MLKGTDVSQRVEFSSAEDKSDPKTIFVLRPLNALEAFEVARKMDMETQSLTPEYVIALLGKAVVEIKNPDLKEAQEVFDFVVSLPITILLEIVTEANTLNKLSDEETKN